jgi:Uma2 family endonuclease
MDWQDVCAHPGLKNLPFKIELNERGQILMTPVKLYHSAYQGRISVLLHQHLPPGQILEECAVRTRKGTKVADVAWMSEARFAPIRDQAECPIAPEICVEVLSDSNTRREMNEKRRLYFAAGASEVWLCDPWGGIRFYGPGGELERSALAPGFPGKI